MAHAGRYDLAKLKETMLALIANRGPLPPERRDYALVGDWAGHRECHIGGDFLLIYRYSDDGIVFVRVGTHADLFE
jgi:mRNA interferase YafQ